MCRTFLTARRLAPELVLGAGSPGILSFLSLSATPSVSQSSGVSTRQVSMACCSSVRASSSCWHLEGVLSSLSTHSPKSATCEGHVAGCECMRGIG